MSMLVRSEKWKIGSWQFKLVYHHVNEGNALEQRRSMSKYIFELKSMKTNCFKMKIIVLDARGQAIFPVNRKL